MDEKLISFVDHARDKGIDHATIRRLLLSVGWKEKDIADAICTRELELSIPVPTSLGISGARSLSRPGKPWPRKARDAFLHLLMYGSLYTWATGLILLIFTYINFAFPDPAWRTSHQAMKATLSIIRAELAAVIVSFPIFLILWNYLLREVRSFPETAKGVIRRWVGYLSLFIGTITLSGDGITLIYYLLEGQLTARFVLKVVALFLITGGLVGYLAFTLRSETHTENEK